MVGFLCLVNLSIDNVWTEDETPLFLEVKGLSLDECIRFAAQNSFEIKLARLDFLVAETDQGIAESIFDTNFSIDLSYEKDKREPLSTLAGDNKQTNIYSVETTKKFPSGTELTLSLDDTRKWDNSGFVTRNPAHTAELSFEARQPLGKNIFGYIDRRDVSAIYLAIQNADLDTQERIESLFAEVERAYWDWAFSKRNLELYGQILEKAQDLHQSNANNYDIGRIEKGDFLASGANVLIREKDLLIAENKYRRAEEKVKLLLNIGSAYRVYPRQNLEYKKQEFALEKCLRGAFAMRRDYRQAKREIERQYIILETKENARWPEIDLVASFAANGIDAEFGRAINDITTDGNTDYYLGLEISLPLENNLAQSEFDRARHNKEKALITLKNIERTVATEIGDAFRDHLTYQTNVAKVKEAALLQQEKLKEEEKRFKYGRSSTKRLIDYQQDYLNAQLEVAKGLLNLETARINLEKNMNIILKKYEGLL